MTNRGFTEAVPLSLSSMAHMTMPLEEGVLDGLKQVLQHTLLSCVNYARANTTPHNWTFRDLMTSPHAWEPHLVDESSPFHASNTNPRRGGGGGGGGYEIPISLTKLGFTKQYHRTCFIYLRKDGGGNPDNKNSFPSRQEEISYMKDWTGQNEILGRITLLYATPALMTIGELNGDEEDEDTPKCVLYNVLVEYRSLPATGKKSAVQAEELSMLSFGGSVDDDVKYGALASLYDAHAKYVLEIYSVRGKKYKFDLMDSTLSDGTVPRLPSRGMDTSGVSDPFVKSLCVTVTDHDALSTGDEESNGGTDTASGEPSSSTAEATAEGKPTESDNKEESTTPAETEAASAAKKASCALTRIHLTMEGNLRTKLDQVLPPYFIATEIQLAFLSLNPNPPDMATATPSGHTLLLDPKEAGKVYINGRYVTTWGLDPKIGSHFPALFGMDLHSIPYWHGRIFDYDILKRHYAQMWQEVLTDARLRPLNIGGRLLSRLITGHDPVDLDDDEDDQDEQMEDNDAEEEKTEGGENTTNNDAGAGAASKPKGPPASTNVILRADTGKDCLESQVMQSNKYDPVGISAKALATTFKVEFEEEGFPCMAHEIDWVKDRLPGRVPVPVPPRVIHVLRRGGYFDTKRTSDEVWFSNSRPFDKEKKGEEELVDATVKLLKEAGCNDVDASSIVFFNGESTFLSTNPIQKKGLVRFHRSKRKYHVNEYFLEMDLKEILGEDNTEDDDDDEADEVTSIPDRAFLLGLHIAKEHPDGTILIRYLLKHRKSKEEPSNNKKRKLEG